MSDVSGPGEPEALPPLPPFNPGGSLHGAAFESPAGPTHEITGTPMQSPSAQSTGVPPQQASTTGPQATAPPRGAAPPVMRPDFIAGPPAGSVGWWIASDGRWYPPELHPAHRSGWPVTAAAASNPGNPHDPPYGPSVTARGRRNRKRGVMIGVASVVVLTLVAGVLLATHGSGGDADAAIVRAVTSAIGDKTAHVEASSSVTVAGTSVAFTGSGAVDFTDNALQMTLDSNIGGQQLNIQAIYLGGVIYEGLPQIAELAPGKSWVSLDVSSLEQAAGQSAASGLGGNPLAMLHALALQGNQVADLGPATIDGESVQGYSVTLNHAVLGSEMANADLPDWMKQAVSQVQVNGGGEKVYITNSGDLVRQSMQMTEKVGSAGEVVSLNQSLDYSDYGAPVAISAPPADQVVPFSQFLELAGQTTS